MTRLLCGSASIGILYSVFNFVLIPSLTDRLGSTALAGNLVSTGMLITVFTGMLLGYLGDRRGKHLIYTKLLFMITIIMLIALSFRSALLLHFVTVAFVASTFSILTPYSALVSSVSMVEARDRNYGFIMGTVNISMFISSIFIGLITVMNVETVFVVFSIAVLIFTTPLFLSRSSRFMNTSSLKASTGHTFRLNRSILLILLSQFGIWFSIGGLLPYLTSFISSGFSVSLGIASTVMGISTLTSGVTSILTGGLCKSLGRSNLYIISLSILICMFLSVSILFDRFLSVGLLLPTILLFVFSIALGVVYALNMAIVSGAASSANQGKIFGANNIVLVSSQSLSLALIGFIISSAGYRGAFLLVMGGFLMALIFYVLHLLNARSLATAIPQ